VLVRGDLNVPLHTCADGTRTVDDDFRIRSALPTIQWLHRAGARVTVCSHLGDPAVPGDPALTIDPVRARLDALCPGIELMENLRFAAGEKQNDPAFAAQLASGMDVYVNEAYGVSHRRHASVVGVAPLLPSAAGLRLALEIEVLGTLLDAPARPFVAVVGGAKIADKLGVLESLAQKVDSLLVGGGMAFTFLAAMGHHVGASLIDVDRIEACRTLLHSGVDIVLPTDIVALEPGGAFGPPDGAVGPRGSSKITGMDLPDGWMGLDIGPESAAAFGAVVRDAGTVLWNGPLGAFEDERFAQGTQALAMAMAGSSAYTVVGGGDSVSALDALGLTERVDFVSTGGGASLAYIEHGDLPGLEALRSAPNAPRTGC